MYIWFPYNTLISWVRPYKTPPLKARKASTAKDLTMTLLPPGILYGFRIRTRSRLTVRITRKTALAAKLSKATSAQTPSPSASCSPNRAA